MRECILVIGHGSPNKEANNVANVTEMLHRLLHPGCNEDCVKVAYLRFVGPGVMETIKTCIEQGAKTVILHPFFLGAGLHVTKEIPGLTEQAKKQYPGVAFVCSEPLGIHEKQAEIIAERIRAAIPKAL